MNNTVIKVLNKEHGEKVIEFFKTQGVDTRGFLGHEIGYYYGVIDHRFNFFLPSELPNSINIIELPTERTFPRVMYVSDSDNITHESEKRVVFMQKCGKYIAWIDAKTIEESESETSTTTWNFAKEIDEVKQPIELTLEQAIQLLEEKLKQPVKIV